MQTRNLKKIAMRSPDSTALSWNTIHDQKNNQSLFWMERTKIFSVTHRVCWAKSSCIDNLNFTRPEIALQKMYQRRFGWSVIVPEYWVRIGFDGVYYHERRRCCHDRGAGHIEIAKISETARTTVNCHNFVSARRPETSMRKNSSPTAVGVVLDTLFSTPKLAGTNSDT